MYENFPKEDVEAVFGDGKIPEKLMTIGKKTKSFNVSTDVDVEKMVKPLPKKKKEFNGPNIS